MADHRADRLAMSLDELEEVTTVPPAYDSALVTRCTALRRKPIGEFGVADLRIMIGQQIGLRWLLPLAVEALERNPMAEGDYYPGDLLCAVLRADADGWKTSPDLPARLRAIMERVDPSENDYVARAFQSFNR
jgi:hypothetical protein